MSKSWFDHTAARVVSLLLALSMSALILINPHFLIADDGNSYHGLLMLLLACVSIGFIHGVGFSPGQRFWHLFFSPWLSWPPILIGLWLAFIN
jgi:cyd operon protein YbgE